MSWLSKTTGKFGNFLSNPLDSSPGGGAYSFNQVWDDYTGKTAVKQQNEYNLQMWHLQNEYNTPANQVARLRAAGLNPNLFYSQGNTGNAASAPEMTAHQGSAAKAFDLAKTFYAFKNMLAQNKNLDAQTGNIKAQTAQHLADVEYKNAVLDFYNKHGYFPGQTSAPLNIVGEVQNQPFVKHSADAAGYAVGKVVGKLTTNTDKDYTPNADFKSAYSRAERLASDAAGRKGLSGTERSDYMYNFIRAYLNAHSYK